MTFPLTILASPSLFWSHPQSLLCSFLAMGIEVVGIGFLTRLRSPTINTIVAGSLVRTTASPENMLC